MRDQRRFRIHLLSMALLISLAPALGWDAFAAQDENPLAACPVTPYAAEGLDDRFTTTWYTAGDFWAGLDSAYGGVWYAAPGFMKVQWRRPPGQALTVEGRRLDGSAPPLQAFIPSGYYSDFQPSALTFSTAGCWEVVGRILGNELRFVVYVHPGEENPLEMPLPTDPAIWETLRRPLVPDRLAPGAACPRTASRQVTRVEGTVLGEGPLYVQGLSAEGQAELSDAAGASWIEQPAGAGALPVRWIASPDYVGPVLIRGWQLDGPNELRFNARSPQSEVRYSSLEHLSTPDWRVWGRAAEIVIPSPGCYALQVDGRDFTEIVVFEAVATGA